MLAHPPQKSAKLPPLRVNPPLFICSPPLKQPLMEKGGEVAPVAVEWGGTKHDAVQLYVKSKLSKSKIKTKE